MTVCLGALCADADGNAARAIVVVSDRMVTLGNITEFEHEVPKIQVITDNLVALTAGDALRGFRLIKEVMTALPKDVIDVEQIVSSTAKRYSELRKRQIESDVFQKRNMNINDFYRSGIQHQMVSALAGAIDKYVDEYDFGLELMMAGIDDSGAHLYSIENPGDVYSEHLPIGYHAIGSGTLHALQSMIGFGHTAARGLHETIFAVYASKRRAEFAPGVGRDTDMMVISKDGVTKIEGDVLAQLEQVYAADYLQPVRQETKDKLDEISFFGGEK